MRHFLTSLTLFSVCALGVAIEIKNTKPIPELLQKGDSIDDMMFDKNSPMELFKVFKAHLSEEDQQELEESGERPEMEKSLQALKGKTFLFVGDSQIRRQYESLCLLLHATPSSARDKHQTLTESQCKGEGISANFISSNRATLDYAKLTEHVSKNGQPYVIYWNAAQNWANMPGNEDYKDNSKFGELVTQSIETIIEVAPKSRMVFSLSPTPRREISKERPHEVDPLFMWRLNNACLEVMKGHTDGEERPIEIVDSFALTADRSDLTEDGVHYNELLWQLLGKMLKAVQ